MTWRELCSSRLFLPAKRYSYLYCKFKFLIELETSIKQSLIYVSTEVFIMYTYVRLFRKNTCGLHLYYNEHWDLKSPDVSKNSILNAP